MGKIGKRGGARYETYRKKKRVIIERLEGIEIEKHEEDEMTFNNSLYN